MPLVEKETPCGKSEFGFVKGPGSYRELAERIDLGIALLHVRCIPGVPLTQADIAAWVGCSRGAICLIERAALKKLRKRLQYLKDPRLIELVDELMGPARSLEDKVA